MVSYPKSFPDGESPPSDVLSDKQWEAWCEYQDAIRGLELNNESED